MIRLATPADLPAIVHMGLRFLSTVYASKIIAPDPDRMARTATWLLENEERALFVSEAPDGTLTGMIGLFIFEHPMTAERTASEMFWWIEPAHRGHGMRLLRVARAWAKEAGATALQLVAPDEKVALLYQRLGYRQIETAYAGVL